MRKLLIFLTFLLSLTGYAAERSLDDAYKIAYDFVVSTTKTKSFSVSLKMIYTGFSPATRSSGEKPAYYIFDNVSAPGFVIVSADDAARTILGYSNTFDFGCDNIPSNLQWWLDQMNYEIASIRSAGMSRVPVSKGSATPVRLYETAKWDQYAPYNQECPVISKNGTKLNPVTGCGPTALAILMRYMKYPYRGIGSTSQYVTDRYKVTVPSRNLEHTYDWEQMPLSYSGSWTSQQKYAIAQLMADIGAAANVDYGLASSYDSGTLMYHSSVVPAVTTYFGYDKSAVLAMRTYYSDNEWYALIKSELDANGPILYSGQTDDSGHFFVLDGYDSDNHFHVNWGWGGTSDGYYALSAMAPENQGAGSSEGGYNREQTALIGLKPDYGGTSPLLLYHYCVEIGKETYKGLYVTEYDSVTGLPSLINIGGILNYSAFTCSDLEVRLVVVDANMCPVKEMWRKTIPSLSSNEYVFYRNIVLKDYGQLQEGYSLVSQYYDPSVGEWKLIKAGWETEGVDTIVLVPIEQVDRNVSLKYDNATGSIILCTGDDLTISCTCDGEVVRVISDGNGQYTIQCDKEKLSVYSITIAKEQKQKTLKVTVGKNKEDK